MLRTNGTVKTHVSTFSDVTLRSVPLSVPVVKSPYSLDSTSVFVAVFLPLPRSRTLTSSHVIEFVGGLR